MKRHRPSKATMQEDHDRWLMKRGVHPTQLAKKLKVSPNFPDYTCNPIAPTSDKGRSIRLLCCWESAKPNPGILK